MMSVNSRLPYSGLRTPRYRARTNEIYVYHKSPLKDTRTSHILHLARLMFRLYMSHQNCRSIPLPDAYHLSILRAPSSILPEHHLFVTKPLPPQTRSTIQTPKSHTETDFPLQGRPSVVVRGTIRVRLKSCIPFVSSIVVCTQQPTAF